MKIPLLIAASFFTLTLSAQSGVLKTIGNAAKTKVEQQDFNSSRSNKEKEQLNNDRRRSVPAPGAQPVPSAPDTITVTPAAPVPDTTNAAPAAPASSGTVTPSFGQTKHNGSYTLLQHGMHSAVRASAWKRRPEARPAGIL